MANWILDLNKLINTKDYPDIDLQSSAHNIISSYGQSTIEKERENIKGNINLYINNLKDKINDPLILKKYNLLLTIEKELGVVDQTHPIVEIVVSKPEGPKINTDPDNMVMPSNIVVDKRQSRKRELSYAEQDELIKMDEDGYVKEDITSNIMVDNIDDLVIPDTIDLGNGEIIDLHAPAPTPAKPETTVVDNKISDPIIDKRIEVEKIVIEIDDSKLSKDKLEEYNKALNSFMGSIQSEWMDPEIRNSSIEKSYNTILNIYEEYKSLNHESVIEPGIESYEPEVVEELLVTPTNIVEDIIDEKLTESKNTAHEIFNQIDTNYLTSVEQLDLANIINAIDEEKSNLVLINNHINTIKTYIDLVNSRKQAPTQSVNKIKEVNDVKEKELPKVEAEPTVVNVNIEEKPKIERTPNPNVKEYNVSFDEIAKEFYRSPDPKILRGNGTKLEKLIKYKNSEVNGRKIYLPDSNYEVIVNQVHDRTQINFMYNLMIQNGINLDDFDTSMKEEFIHILYDHCIFPLQDDISYNDFISNLSPNDLELLFVVFSLVNTKLNKDNILPLHVNSVQCDNCDSYVSLKNEMVLDLAQEFKNIYDTERFISNYKIYRNSNFKSIREAYVSGEYGKVTKLTYDEHSFNYSAYICRPTVQKHLLIKSNNELIAYRTMATNFTKQAEYLRKTMDDADKIIDYLNTHSYAQFKGDIDYINKNKLSLTTANLSDDDKLMIESVSSILTQMDEVLSDLAPIFFAALIIDNVVISTIDNYSTSFRLTDGDIYEFIEVIRNQLPSAFIEELAARAEEMDYISKDVKIFFTADELADNLDFYSVYKTPEDLEKVLRENNVDEDTIKSELDRINKLKEDFDKSHTCTKCGHSIYKISYNSLLFFSITNLLN